MSKIDEVITLEVNYLSNKENIESKIYECKICHGAGYKMEEICKEWHKQECAFCQGKGYIKAHISIEWKGCDHDGQSTKK